MDFPALAGGMVSSNIPQPVRGLMAGYTVEPFAACTCDMTDPNPFAAPRANVDGSGDATLVDIDRLPVSEKWKEKFRLFRKAGAPKFSRLKDLPPEERKRASFGFNILAFLFGPFYYLAKGMWRRGVTLLVVCIAVVAGLEILFAAVGWHRLGNALGYGIAAVYAVRANIDYYKKMVLGDNGWW
jgi:hypothetical protein